MVSKKSRSQLMAEFAQSYRLTGQLFYKLLQMAVQENPGYAMAYLPILKTLKQQGSMTQSAIARELFHSGAAVSRQIGILAGEGLVATKPDEQNRRATIVSLTKKGEELLGDIEATVMNFLDETLENLSDKQLERLISDNQLLQKTITSTLEKEPCV